MQYIFKTETMLTVQYLNVIGSSKNISQYPAPTIRYTLSSERIHQFCAVPNETMKSRPLISKEVIFVGLLYVLSLNRE